MKSMFFALVALMFVFGGVANAEVSKSEPLEPARRGIGFAYRSAPIVLTFEGEQFKKTINLISLDMFSYRISKNRFLGGFTIIYGTEGSLIEYASLDIYGGKSYTLIPKILRSDIRFGIVSATLNYDNKRKTEEENKIWSDHLGGFVAGSLHLDLFGDGSSFYAEWEIRGLSESPLDSNGDIENYGILFNNSVPAAFRNFSYRSPFISQGIRFGYKLYF